jgi:hypothetical protein
MIALSLGQYMERVAIAVTDVLDLCHFFLEDGVIGCNQVPPFRGLYKIERLPVASMKAIDDFFG